MKKYIFSILMAVVAAFTFNSCADVPEPYTQPEKPDDSSSTTTGKGSESDPYTVAEAIEVIKAGAPTTEVYVTGIISEVSYYSSDYKSLSYYISDDGKTNDMQVYSGKGLNGADFSSKSDLKAGQKVTIKGVIKAFTKNDATTMEIDKNSIIVKIEDGDSSTTPDTPTTGKGSESDPYTVVEAIEVINAGAPTTEVYLTGIISEVTSYSDTFKSITYYISDDGKSKDMQVYSGKGLNGADFSSKDDLKVGQKVTIKGIIKAYTNKSGTTIMEVDKTSSIIKIEDGGSTTPDSGTSGAVTTNENGTFESWTDGKPVNWTTTSTAGNATLSQSTDAHSGSYSVNVGGSTSANKRIGYKELELKAGTYTIKFYAKAATTSGGSVRPGVALVTDGTASTYVYGDYVNNLSSTTWTLVEQNVEVSSDGTYSFVIMNSKKPGADVLIDDFTVMLGSTTIIK